MRKVIYYLAVSLLIISFNLDQASLAASSNIDVHLQVNQPIVCGDNVKQAGEECDGLAGVPTGYYCTNQCVLALSPVINANSVILPQPQPTAVHEVTPPPLVDIIAPANVSNFSAAVEGGAIRLTWLNPAESDFRAVKIMRSDKFYPQNFRDGVSLYNDAGQTYLDQGAAVGVRYYYTAFAYDNNANYSSGSIASAMITAGRLPGEEEILPLPPAPPAPPQELFEIELADFTILAANQTIRLNPANGYINLLPGTIINLQTEQAKYPKVLKSIILTITPKTGQSAAEAKSYLLRADEQKDIYATTFTAPVKINQYDMQIVFLNFNNSKIAKTKEPVAIKEFGRVQAVNNPQLSLVKSALAAENQAPAVFGAEITLFSYNNGKLEKWQGGQYSQFNPMLSNQAGQYGFLAPNGTYLLKIKKDNYYQYASLPFTVEDHLINKNIELIYYPRLDYKKYFWLLIISIFIYLFLNRIIKKKKPRS